MDAYSQTVVLCANFKMEATVTKLRTAWKIRNYDTGWELNLLATSHFTFLSLTRAVHDTIFKNTAALNSWCCLYTVLYINTTKVLMNMKHQIQLFPLRLFKIIYWRLIMYALQKNSFTDVVQNVLLEIY